MNILLSGCAGFIGFHVSNLIIKKYNNFKLIGIDNLNNYYSVPLKKKRLKILKESKKFKFLKLDLRDKSKLNRLFKQNKIDIVIHLAAQAGVRHSINNPKSYYESNIVGFLNIIELSNKYKVNKFIYASSSSVYGDSDIYPLKENFRIFPKNIYSASKNLNEVIANDLSKISKMKFIGLRFFTIYGIWGRPDMLIFKYLKKSFNKKTFYLNNFGNHSRDFTHIDDAINIIDKLIKKKIKNNHMIFNICSNNPINIKQLINKINMKIKIKTKIKKIQKNNIEVLDTNGDNRKIKKYLNIKKFKNIFKEIPKIIDWYDKEKIWKLGD